ncbi:LPP20 family lipoprotein [Flavobacterium sp. W21_SRS_FM6]|uniref:LPP20 family lipoprotein n=1 Tax=Flavobacterium sp. W21_SRS_FM6 TaxID=3240268 RepID=UPI003F8EF3AD
MNYYLKITAVVLAVCTASCSSFLTKQVEWETIEPTEYPIIKAVGYAPISAQKGQNEANKMLMALKASKLDAYRELAEQVFGQKVDGEQLLANLVLDDARLSSSVQGVIRGAKVIKSYPVGNDTYATELELDFKLVHDIYLSTAKPQRVKKVRYY